MDYEGSVYVDPATTDDDFIGFVFSYQNDKSFYVASWKRHIYLHVPGRAGLAIKVTVLCTVVFFVLYCLVISYYRKLILKPDPVKGCKMLFGGQIAHQTKYSCLCS